MTTSNQQYEALYGPYQRADHELGDTLSFDGGLRAGTVLWSCQKDGRAIYVVDAGLGWPVEVDRREVIEQ